MIRSSQSPSLKGKSHTTRRTFMITVLLVALVCYIFFSYRFHSARGGMATSLVPRPSSPWKATPSKQLVVPPFVPCVCMDPKRTQQIISRKDCLIEEGDSLYDRHAPFAEQPKIDGLYVDALYMEEQKQKELVELLESYTFQPYPGKTCLEFGLNYSIYIKKPTSSIIPPAIKRIGADLFSKGLLKFEPNFILVNKYEPGEGIHPHIDDPWYSDGIGVLVLGQGSALYWGGPHGQCHAVRLEAGGLFTMHRDARYNWKHEMPRRDKDVLLFPPRAEAKKDDKNVVGSIKTFDRGLRYALTFRHVPKPIRRGASRGY